MKYPVPHLRKLSTKVWVSLASISVCTTLVIGVQALKFSPSQISQASIEVITPAFDPLSHEPLELRISQLTRNPQPRQRLLLAELSLQKNDPRSALTALEGLENEYQLLADIILLKRAQAFTQLGNPAQAQPVWQELLSRYGDRPSAGEALWALNRKEELITKFPSHPRTRDALLAMIKTQPQNLELIRQLAVYFPDTPQIVPLLNRLTSGNINLTPDQWWSIGNAYYDNFEFTRAGNAYSRATANSFTQYRQGRSWHRAKQAGNALTAYRNLVDKYPQSPEAPRALIRIMQLGNSSEVQSASDRLMKNYPDTAGEGLLLRAERGVNREQALQLLLSQYGNSDASAQWRWQVARDQAKRGRLRKAISTVQSIVANNPSSPVLAESAFWGGKWSQKLGDTATARQLFTTALRLQPDSYFAWRSAVSLGWTEVGDFTTARNVTLALRPVTGRSSLPAGSAVVNELYVIGLDRDAYSHWQTEIRGRQLLKPREIFTDGVLRIGVNDNLMGIRTLESLTWIDVSAPERQEIAQLISTPLYRQSLYPFPYFAQIQKWSQEFNLPPALVIALIRQESRFESQILSSAGAVGLMQVMPETGAWIASKRGIRNYSLKNPEDNINFGTWYLDFTHQEFNNNSMLAVASYNAGPGAIGRWVSTRGLGNADEFVNNIPYAETRDYVPKVFGNYWNYLLLYSPVIQQRMGQFTNNSAAF